ncbi:phage major capsid protein [Mycobacterium shinjukuense]|uniref:Phage capsid protein n=1 Tax=Mycobacterium shinjukuense TaxID=398694 RepID=A0A7I7MJ65_9MYCO|nr:phage major capsid protein [Mycobacterium shinjukuense]MCV6987090.1 phage major capsid protein [Mycobacterium shinjukuense]ORB61642.1 major capsid protein [Mycobacterium shinjukuense]BBX72215.1 phage capsid protein [Mycobacterium shinjukuense]BBX73912.1 phage capsid protein [Mycobacterium shinjukuense]
MTDEQHEFDDIKNLSLDETRAAAQQLLDTVEGDLTGEAAQRFQALCRHAEELRSEQRRRGLQAAEALRRVQAGELRVVPGAPTGDDVDDAPPRNTMRDTALRTLDGCVRDGLMTAGAAETAETLCRSGPPQSASWAQRWLAATGSRDYLNAFVKRVSNPVAGHTVWTTAEAAAWREAAAVAAEQRAMGLVDTAGGFLVPAALDPAILLSSGGSTNPIRQVARVVQTTAEIWRGVTSEGAQANWYHEAEEVSDDSPTLAQPAVPAYRGSAWVPFSVEIEGDAAGFVAEVGRILADSIEQLQAAAFVNGTGVGEPTGFVSALTGTNDYVVAGAGTEAVVAADVYALQSALPPRFQANGAFAANLSTINTLRQAETANGALKFPGLHDSPPMLAGKNILEVSHMDTVDPAVTATNHPLVLGDWKQFLIVDRVGAMVELVPHLFGPNRRPTGQRGFFAWFRTGSDVLVPNAFRILRAQTTA